MRIHPHRLEVTLRQMFDAGASAKDMAGSPGELRRMRTALVRDCVATLRRKGYLVKDRSPLDLTRVKARQ